MAIIVTVILLDDFNHILTTWLKLLEELSPVVVKIFGKSCHVPQHLELNGLNNDFQLNYRRKYRHDSTVTALLKVKTISFKLYIEK